MSSFELKNVQVFHFFFSYFLFYLIFVSKLKNRNRTVYSCVINTLSTAQVTF